MRCPRSGDDRKPVSTLEQCKIDSIAHDCTSAKNAAVECVQGECSMHIYYYSPTVVSIIITASLTAVELKPLFIGYFLQGPLLFITLVCLYQTVDNSIFSPTADDN